VQIHSPARSTPPANRPVVIATSLKTRAL